MLKYFIIFIAFTCFFSCDLDSNNKEKVERNLNTQFILKDSILLDYLGNVQITDYLSQKQSYLGLDLSSNSIIHFNDKGEMLYDPILTGEGPGLITGTIFSLGYLNDESILVQTRIALYKLNFKGDILKKIDLPNETLYSYGRFTNYVRGKKVYLLHDNNTALRPIYREYFDQVRHVTVVDLEDESINTVIPFEDESMYKNNDYYYRMSIPAISLNKIDSSINIIYPYEKKIYQYEIGNSYSLRNIIDTNPSNFKEPERANYSSDFNTMKSLAYDSYYLNIFNNSNFIMIEYVTGLPLTISPPQSLSELNELFIDNNERYYEIFKDGKKVGEDLRRPSGMMDLKYFHENNTVLFQLDKRKVEKDYEVFYIYEIDSV
jgi:hypothetical protein